MYNYKYQVFSGSVMIMEFQESCDEVANLEFSRLKKIIIDKDTRDNLLLVKISEVKR